MKKIRKCVTILLILTAGICMLSAEVYTTASISDFEELASLWNEARAENEYSRYQEKFASVTDSVIPDNLYQYMLGEALFYEYFAKTYVEFPENEALDDSLISTIEYCVSVQDEYPAVRTVLEIFRSLTHTAPFSMLSDEPVFAEPLEPRPVEESMLPSADTGRLLMLRTLAEVEAMNQRLLQATETRGADVLLKFSSEAFLNVMEKPAMIYVIRNEPVYADLLDVLERSSAGVDVDSYGPVADAFYLFEQLVVQCEEIAASKGLPLSDVLSEEAWTAMMLYHTDPFAVLSLNETAFDILNGELQFVAEKSLEYVDRINGLPEKRESIQ